MLQVAFIDENLHSKDANSTNEQRFNELISQWKEQHKDVKFIGSKYYSRSRLGDDGSFYVCLAVFFDDNK